MKPRKKTKQTGINGAKYSGYKCKKYTHASKDVFARKAHSHYKATPPRSKPAPDNLTYINKAAYLEHCKRLNEETTA